MKNVAIIPARGGSKGLKRKNIALLRGNPLIFYTIKACSESGCFDRIICSTEDSEIAAVARACGAEVPFLRPASFAEDCSTIQDAIAYTLRALKTREGYVADTYSVLYPTYPFRTLELVREVVERTMYYAANSVTAIPTIIDANKYVTVSPDGRAVSLSKKDSGIVVYRSIGSIFSSKILPEGKMVWDSLREYYAYLNSKTLFERDNAYMSFNHYVPIRNKFEAVDINTPQDLAKAELILGDGLFEFEWERGVIREKNLVKA